MRTELFERRSGSRPTRTPSIRRLGSSLILAFVASHAQAGVLQQVNTGYQPAGGAAPITSTDTIFVPTSADVNRNIFAQVGAATGFYGVASAGVFGQVGLETQMIASPPATTVFAEVLVGSDEFVNVSGSAGTVSSRFIVDGGSIADFFSTDTTVSFQLEVGAQVLGAVGPETSQPAMETATRITAAFGSAGGFFPGFDGGGYSIDYTTDVLGLPSFSTSVNGGLDLGATFDPLTGIVDIPFSVQDLDLGMLLPGERLMVAYRASLTIDQRGVSEGIRAQFSDPFNLGSTAILSALRFTPDNTPSGPGQVPSPGTLALLMLGAAWGLRRPRPHRHRG